MLLKKEKKKEKRKRMVWGICKCPDAFDFCMIWYLVCPRLRRTNGGRKKEKKERKKKKKKTHTHIDPIWL